MIYELCKSNNYNSLGENIFENIFSYLMVKKREAPYSIFQLQKQLFRCVLGERYSVDPVINLQQNTQREALFQ